jgi:hypothetical protein
LSSTLYFAYASFLDPDRIGAVAPHARFLFTAHFPETRLVFVDSEGSEGLPSLLAEAGHTVWGGVFEVPDTEVPALTDAEEGKGESPDGMRRRSIARATSTTASPLSPRRHPTVTGAPETTISNRWSRGPSTGPSPPGG